MEYITSDLKKHTAEAIRLESQVNTLTSDYETQTLAPHLAGIRTRIETLLSQAENGRANAQQKQIKIQQEYQTILTDIEIWIESTKTTIEKFIKPDTQQQIEHSINDFEELNKQIEEKEIKLQELAKICEELKKHPELQRLVVTLIQQLELFTTIINEQRTIIITTIQSLHKHLIEVKEQEIKRESPLTYLENTLDSTSMPIEEIPVHAEIRAPIEEPLVTETTAQKPVATIETQTGRSISSPLKEPLTNDFTVTYNQPVDVQIQTQMSQQTSESEVSLKKETIRISKRTTGGEETIQIATKPMMEESQPIIKEPDDILVEPNYRKRPESETGTSELNISNFMPNQAFETVFVEPDETTTEVIVDADGTKRIIVKKLHRTVVRHQASSQQQELTTFSTITEGEAPVSQTFSQITLKGQQRATTVAKGDGSKATVTSQQYGGKVISGVPGADVDIQEYETEPETTFAVEGPTFKPEEVEIQGIKLHEGDVTFTDNQNNQLVPTDKAQVILEGSEIHTSSSSVRAVVQQVTRKIIRKTRRIIRRTVIIDGKEHITEEIVEEPEEVEATEEGIPRISINVTKTEDGQIVKQEQFGDATDVFEEPKVTITQKTTTVVVVPDGKPVEKLPENVTVLTQPEQRYVVEHNGPLPESTLTTTEIQAQQEAKPVQNITYEFLESERLNRPTESSEIERAPSVDTAPKDQGKRDGESLKTPNYEPFGDFVIKETVLIHSADKQPLHTDVTKTTTVTSPEISTTQEKVTIVSSTKTVDIPSENDFTKISPIQKITTTQTPEISEITKIVVSPTAVEEESKISPQHSQKELISTQTSIFVEMEKNTYDDNRVTPTQGISTPIGQVELKESPQETITTTKIISTTELLQTENGQEEKQSTVTSTPTEEVELKESPQEIKTTLTTTEIIPTPEPLKTVIQSTKTSSPIEQAELKESPQEIKSLLTSTKIISTTEPLTTEHGQIVIQPLEEAQISIASTPSKATSKEDSQIELRPTSSAPPLEEIPEIRADIVITEQIITSVTPDEKTLDNSESQLKIEEISKPEIEQVHVTTVSPEKTLVETKPQVETPIETLTDTVDVPSTLDVTSKGEGPEKEAAEAIETAETYIQTVSPIKPEIMEEAVQTITPEVPEVVQEVKQELPRTESAIQASVESVEDSVQTKSPEIVETSEISTQIQPEVSELALQTSPEPSAPPAPLEEVHTTIIEKPETTMGSQTYDTFYTVSQPDEQKPKTASIKPKGKNKHVSSVTIEEIESQNIAPYLPLSPAADGGPLSPPDYDTSTWKKPTTDKAETKAFIITETQQVPLLLKEVNIKWNQAQAIERFKNLQNARKTTHLSDVLYLATLNEIITEETLEQHNDNVQQNLVILQNAIEKRDVIVIQQSIITTVETITTWLETIEYRIYVNRQQTSDGPSSERVQEFNDLKQEIANIETKVEQLQQALEQTGNIYNEDNKLRMKNYIDSLQQQVKVIEEVTEQNEQLASGDLKRWDDFENGVVNITQSVRELRRQLSDLKESDAAPQTKLNELEMLDNRNRCYNIEMNHLMASAKSLMRDFPGKEIQREVYLTNELTKQLEHLITIERERVLQYLSLADEYEQTLKEFRQVILVAEALIESPIMVRNLEHLEDEMQNHRKFFVNLSHCRAILESLEENLDSETRALHSELHQNLYERGKNILDQSIERFKKMSLYASKWTVLEQGTKEEFRLQVAQQRVPDLNSVTSSDFERYIDLYELLAIDIAYHHDNILHLYGVLKKLQELIRCPSLEPTYRESLDIIGQLHGDVENNLKKLTQFRGVWTTYHLLSNKVEYWLKDAEIELKKIESSTGSRTHLRQFWELKAQHEVHAETKQNASSSLEKALMVVPISDEMVQRKFHSELNTQWQHVSKKISDIEASIMETISAPNIPVNEKLVLLEQELQDVKVDIDSLKGVLKTEEIDLYVERLQIMLTRLETIQNELSKLGLLSAGESDKVGTLLGLSKRLEIIITEELEGGILLRNKIQRIQKEVDRVRMRQPNVNKQLDQCEGFEKLGNESVEQALNGCYDVEESLRTLGEYLVTLRKLLHTLPMRLKVTVSPKTIERDISQLRDIHTGMEKRCKDILALIRNRLALWQRFERQLELVQQSVKEGDFMVEITVQGTVDYGRLRKATEQLESVSSDLNSRENLVDELRSAAQPLADYCAPEVAAKIEAAVKEAVTAYETTCTNLKELCDKYQHATELWKQYKEASDLVKEWLDNPMEEVENLEPEEAVEKVKVRQVYEDTLAVHSRRLAELRQLVASIASAVGLDANALLGGEVEALGKRLEDVRESLTQLADVAEAKLNAKNEAKKQINGQRTFLDSVQKSLNNLKAKTDTTPSETKLVELRDHLLTLSKAQGQIEDLKDKAVEVATVRTEISVVEILELWQQVFKETFQQYHRLSTRLIKTEGNAAALKFWEEYLLNVQQFLQGTIPGDYHSLSEHQHLCQVHQNLLTTQQNVLKPKDSPDGQLASSLVETSVMEQFNSLTYLHNETLSRIMDRHAEVQKRMNAWEKYKQHQNKLLTWLKGIEKERERMQLRYMHIRRIPKLLSRIQSLSEKIPQGETQAENLQRQQNYLLQFCDDALATSIRMEHVAIKQRLSNLQARLDTWKHFLERISTLIKSYDDKVEKLQKFYDEIQEIINESLFHTPSSHSSTGNKLDVLETAKERLNTSTKDLEQLELSQEQLKECLSPSDMKNINQRIWLLIHQKDDLDHELSTLCHQVEDKLASRSMFEDRHARFINWINDLERRIGIENGIESSSSISYPQEIIPEVDSLRKYHWLVRTGKELVESCGEEYADVTAKQIIQARADEVSARWKRLNNDLKEIFDSFRDLRSDMLTLEYHIAKIRPWLTQIEVQLAKPLVFEPRTKEIIDEKDHDKLKKSIENESGYIGKVLNSCERLLSDPNLIKYHISTENISQSVQNLEKRWKVVCGESAERKRKITFIWKLLQEVLKLNGDQEQWLTEKETCLKELDKIPKKLSKNEIQQLIYAVESEIKDIESRTPAFQILEQTYSKLVTASGIEPENIQELTTRARVNIARWENLMPKANAILQKLQNELVPFREFSLAQEDSVVGLTRLDAQLTELQHLSPSDKVNPKDKLKKLQEFEDILSNQTPTLENVDKLGLQIMKRSKPQEVTKIQEMIDKYQILFKNIQERLNLIKTEIRKEIEQMLPREVDEEVQVETQQDTSFQVDTLPPQLQRITSISAKDAYLVELEAALGECKSTVTELESFVSKEIPQGSSELLASGKKIAKLVAKCQATTELVKHLHDLLINECHATEIEACSEEIYMLIEQFEILDIKAKEKEHLLRELSESEDEAQINTSVLRSGCRFLGRVVRASVPIQAFMLLLLGAATLVPYSEEDYSCSLVNSMANSLTPTLR